MAGFNRRWQDSTADGRIQPPMAGFNRRWQDASAESARQKKSVMCHPTSYLICIVRLIICIVRLISWRVGMSV
jgi:hypothetical protein